MLFLLAQNLVSRHIAFRQPDDIISSVKYFRYLLDNFYPPEAFKVPRDKFIPICVQAMSHFVILKTGDDGSGYMREMADLLRELGTSDFSEGPHRSPYIIYVQLLSAYIFGPTQSSLQIKLSQFYARLLPIIQTWNKSSWHLQCVSLIVSL